MTMYQSLKQTNIFTFFLYTLKFVSDKIIFMFIYFRYHRFIADNYCNSKGNISPNYLQYYILLPKVLHRLNYIGTSSNRNPKALKALIFFFYFFISGHRVCNGYTGKVRYFRQY